MDRTFEQRVRERAYLLWLRDGDGRGRVDHHWFQAVRDTLADGAAASAWARHAPSGSRRAVEPCGAVETQRAR